MFKENPSKNVSIFTKNIYKAARGVNIEYAAGVVNSMKKRTEVNPDTKHRIEIQTCIHKLLSEGNEFAVILNELNKKFPDSKYKEYFSQWIK